MYEPNRLVSVIFRQSQLFHIISRRQIENEEVDYIFQMDVKWLESGQFFYYKFRDLLDDVVRFVEKK